MHDRNHRQVRSYVLRQGRITPAQRKALDDHLQTYGLTHDDHPCDPNHIFGRTAPKILEIGAGAGEFTLQAASRHPENDYLAVEVHKPGIGSLLQGIVARRLANIRVVNQDVVEVLTHLVPAASLDQVMILFPDPWPKRRHHKRRLINSGFLTLLANRMKSHARLYVATDCEDMAVEILSLCDGQPGLQNLAGRGRFAPRPVWRPLTRFEQRGRRLGHTVFDLVYGLR